MDVFQTVATAIDLAIKAKGYLEGVKSAPRERGDLQNQCSDILTLLIGLRDLQETCEVGDPWYDNLGRIGRRDGPVDHLAGKLSDLVEKICRKSRRTWSKRTENLTWPFSTDDILRTRGEIDTILATINAELNIVHILIGHYEFQYWSRETMVRQMECGEEFRAHYGRLRDAQGMHKEGTGAWLWSSSEYQGWLKNSTPQLNCTGVYGAGKTVLASAVFHDLIDRFRSRDVGVAYLFCGLDSIPTPGFINLKAVLLRQLILQVPVISQDIINTHKTATRYGSMAYSSTTIDKTLQIVCRSFNEVFIVVDGLCEFGDSKGVGRGEFLRSIEKMTASSGKSPRIFITSFDALQPEIRVNQSIQARVTDTDLRIVLKDLISGLSHDVQDEVVAAVSQAANGVFLVVDRFASFLCPPFSTVSESSVKERLGQLAQELAQKSPNVKRHLPNLPESITTGYDLALRAIMAQGEPAKSTAKLLLVLMLYPMRPLTTSEVIHAIRIGTTHDFSGFSGVERLLGMAGGLVLKRRNGTLALEHQVLHDFLSQPENREFSDGRRVFTETCIDAILSTDGLKFASATGKYREEREAQEKYPFVAYAIAFWGFHLRDLGESMRNSLRGKALRILRQSHLLNACAQALNKSKVGRVHPAFVCEGSPVHLAAAFDLSSILQELLQHEHLDLLDGYRNTPLHWAAQFGALSATKLLLHHFGSPKVTRQPRYRPSNPWQQDSYGVAQQGDMGQSDLSSPLRRLKFSYLSSAVGTDRESLATTHMVAHKNMKGRTPLSEAAEYGHAEMVKLLLGADSTLYSSKDNFGCTPLFLAATEGHEEVVDILLDAGSDVNVVCRLHNLPWEPEFDSHFPVLSSACVMGHQRVVQMLLEQPGININILDMSPLALAAETGNAVIARLLLIKGAKINIFSREERTPLSYAAESAQTDVVEVLLRQRDININLADQDGRTPLSYAAERGDPDTLKLLLKTPGIRPHLADNNNRTPLSYAAERGNSDVVSLLLEAPHSVEEQMTADVDFKSDWGCTALYYGARSARLSVVEKLLAAGAHPNGTEHCYGETALYCAVEMNFEPIVGVLLDHNADPDVLVQPDTTPLCCAIEKGFKNIIDALIRNGADLNLATPKTGRTPACMAAILGSESLLKDLAAKGADMSKSSLSGWTPVCFASDTCHARALETLVKLGADVHAGPPGETPLLISASKGNDPVLEYLLSNDLMTQEDRLAALSRSVLNGHGSTMRLLLGSLPVDPTALDDDGGTTFGRIAADIFKVSQKVKDDLLSVCRERDDFNFNQRDGNGRTLFWWACASGDTALVSTLCADPGVDVNTTDKYGISPLFACINELLRAKWDDDSFEQTLKQLMTIEALKVNAQDNDGRTALIRVVRSIGPSSRAVAEILLSRNDVDVGVADRTGENALSYARSQRLGWPSGVVELLENCQNAVEHSVSG